jgi:hypothetical protein
MLPPMKLHITLPYTADQLVELSLELIRRNGQRTANFSDIHQMWESHPSWAYILAIAIFIP